MNAKPNANEIVRALRNCGGGPEGMMITSDAADLIESQAARLAEAERRERDARNEICLKCGRYREAHKGACDGCRWKENENEL